MSFDSNLYSRQMYAIGKPAMEKLREAKVLISGIGSVGVEVCKNLVLAGVGHVAIHDTKQIKWGDLSAQYYANEADLGKNRAEASFKRLQELNDSVQCSILAAIPLSEQDVKDFDLIIATDMDFSKQVQVNDWARKHGKRFISADARGLFGYVFVDLGLQFRIEDPNGAACKEAHIGHINTETGEVITLEGARHDFEDGDHITFSEVGGSVELNGHAPIQIVSTTASSFNIGQIARNYHPYTEGGRVKQVKMAKNVDFRSLQESLEKPDMVVWDGAKMDSPKQMHFLWQALYKFEEKHGRSPGVRSVDDACSLRKELPENETVKITEDLLKNFSYQAKGNLQPIASVVGGIVAQEAIKAVSGHTTPIIQFLFIDCMDALPGCHSSMCTDKLEANDCEARNNRYDGQAAVFGWAFQEALLKQRWFLVGAGAIGCELLKNTAMMGIGCDPEKEGKVMITDMDTIEISNLNRQFLFRRGDVGSKKSEVAAASVNQFNREMNIEAFAERVGTDTEHIFNGNFFSSLTGVASALDNIQARRYVDARCVFYQLPLLESGTSGSKGNTQVVYPHITESYSSSNDPPEKETPMCTLKSFPYEIEHTIQWARAKFGDLFTYPAEAANQYLGDKAGFLERLEAMSVAQQIERLNAVKMALVDDKPTTAGDCVLWARKLFEKFYHEEIAQLLHNFPADSVSKGVKFWSGTKRCPHALHFSVDQEYHVEFVRSASILRAQQYGVQELDLAGITQLAAAYQPVEFVPRGGVRIAVTEEEAAQPESVVVDGNSETIIKELKATLDGLGPMNQLIPIDFEKDDDSNHHMEFVTATSNLRAENYNIPPADRNKTKQVAGKIIPALATTTAIVSGLACVELYKMVEVGGKRATATPLDQFKNAYFDLSLPDFQFYTPMRAPVKKYGETNFTLWDRIEIEGPSTVAALIEQIKINTGLEVTMLCCNAAILYADFYSQNKMNERLPRDVVAVLEEITRKPVAAHQTTLVIDACCKAPGAEDDVDIPVVKYNIHRN